MIIYVVKNDDYIQDYFLNKVNAEKERDSVNKLCEEFKYNPNVNNHPFILKKSSQQINTCQK